MIRVLVVDDEQAIRLTVQANLQLAGCEVAVAENARQALEAVQRERFDLVLSDIRMPGMSGIELFRQMRELQPSVPVILMTAFTVESLIDEAMGEGVFTVLPKPFDPDQLVAILERALKRQVVLIIDGDRADAEGARAALAGLGLTAQAVFDEQSSLELVSRGIVDVCIIELSMASAGTPPLITRLRALDRSISFIALFTQHAPELMRTVAWSGSVNWLRKPVAACTLARSIARVRRQPSGR
jgi:two-component system response regulator HydG